MDKAQALHSFWGSFGIPAIDEQSAYDTDTLERLDITYPYITYESATSDLDDSLKLGADLWYDSTTWSDIEQKAAQIVAALGRGGTVIPYEGGALWITHGAARRMAAEVGFDVRRIHIDISAEFLSA